MSSHGGSLNEHRPYSFSVSAHLACGCGSPCRPLPSDRRRFWRHRSSPARPPLSRRPRSSAMAVGSRLPDPDAPVVRRIDVRRISIGPELKEHLVEPLSGTWQAVGSTVLRRPPAPSSATARDPSARFGPETTAALPASVRCGNRGRRSGTAWSPAGQGVAVTTNRSSTSSLGPPWASASPAAPARAASSNAASRRCAERLGRRERNGMAIARPPQVNLAERFPQAVEGHGLGEHEVARRMAGPRSPRPWRRIRSA